MTLPPGEGAWAGGWVATVTPTIDGNFLVLLRSVDGLLVMDVLAENMENTYNSMKDDE